MAVPSFHQDVYEGGLTELVTATQVHACTSEPANQAGIAAVSVGSYTLTPGDGNGDWTIQSDGAGGFEAVLAAQSGNNATGTGAGNVLAFSDGTTLLGVVEGSGQTLNSGAPWTLGSFTVLNMPAATNAA